MHGAIEGGETPVQAALRELQEETGLVPDRLYNLSRVEFFYLHRDDRVVLAPVFVALIDTPREPRLSAEHDHYEWLAPEAAARRYALPRLQRALNDAIRILATGDAGPLEDVLRVC